MGDLQSLIANFRNLRILIVGDVMLDEYIWGHAQRISPEAPVPVIEVEQQTYALGGAANVAANVASLGGQAILAGVVGEDSRGETFHEMLRELGVDGKGVFLDPGRPTTTKTRIIAHSQQLVRVDREKTHPLPPAVENGLLGWIESQIAHVDACLLSDYAKGVLTFRLTTQVIEWVRARHRPIVIDPKGTDYRKYLGASVITPNINEARSALNMPQPPQSIFEIGQHLLHQLDGAAVLITRGAEGLTLFQNGKESASIPAVVRNVYDVTGAGDTLTATLGLALAARSSLEEAAYLANRAAGIVVGKLGTATVTAQELFDQCKDDP